MSFSRRSVVVVLGMLAFAGCATTPTELAARSDGVIVPTEKVILTGSHIPSNVPKNPIAHPEPPMAPVVIIRAGDPLPPFMSMGGPN